jgi:hypothetical protein
MLSGNIIIDYTRRIEFGSIFFGPVFFGHFLQMLNGKLLLPIHAGVGSMYKYYRGFYNSKSYIIYSEHKTYEYGWFASYGLTYRPINLISVGVNVAGHFPFRLSNNYDVTDFWVDGSFNLSLNYHF